MHHRTGYNANAQPCIQFFLVATHSTAAKKILASQKAFSLETNITKETVKTLNRLQAVNSKP